VGEGTRRGVSVERKKLGGGKAGKETGQNGMVLGQKSFCGGLQKEKGVVNPRGSKTKGMKRGVLGKDGLKNKPPEKEKLG